MAEYTVRFADMRKTEAALEQVSRRMAKLSDQIERVGRSTALNGTDAFAGVRRSLRSQGSRTETLGEQTGAMRTALGDIAGIYERIERELMGFQLETHTSDPAGTPGAGFSGGGGGRGWGGPSEAETQISPDEEKDPVIGLIKAYLKYLDKTDQNDAAGLVKDIIEYWEDLKKFFGGQMTGLTGAQDLCDLGKSSSAVWTALYSLLKTFDPTKTKDFIGNFAKQWGKPAAGVDIIGSGLGYVNGLLELLETKGESGYQTAAAFIDLIGDGADVVKSVHDFQTVGELASGNLYTPAGLYAILAKTVSDTTSQFIKSYEKYSADGDFDMNDLSEVMIDGSVKGLYTMFSKLTFGIISEDTTGVSAEDISNGLKSFAKDLGTNIGNYGKETGTRAGQYIVDHPELCEAYNKGGFFTKAAITFYSVFKS